MLNFWQNVKLWHFRACPHPSENSSDMKVIGLIPSRLNSSRLPSKALLDLDGLPVIVHVFKRAQLAKSLDEVYVCTDSSDIAGVVEAHGGKVIMTRSDHTNGTERIAEAALNLTADLFVDVQGDEPLLNPAHIDDVVAAHQMHPDWEILVPALAIAQPESKHVVKIVHDVNHRIMMMSRAAIPEPFRHRPDFYLKHLSIISFQPNALQKFSQLTATPMEIIEGVELLRALEHGMVIGTTILSGNSFSIDIKEDYSRAKVEILTDPIRKHY